MRRPNSWFRMARRTAKVPAPAPAPLDGEIIPPQVELADVAALVPYAHNARKHTPEQIDQIATSFAEWGWTNPILIDEGGGIIAGHGRALAAAKVFKAGGSIRTPNGAELPPGKVPVIRAIGWSEAQKRAYVIADNKLAINASWDDALLKTEFAELKSVGFNLAPIGFSMPEIDLVLAGWELGDDPRQKDGAHLDGISVTIKFHVASEQADAARKACREALTARGIGYEE